MGVVSVRLPEEALHFLREEGIKPGSFAKDLVLKEVRRMQILQARRRLEAVSRKPSKPLVELLREDRDAH